MSAFRAMVKIMNIKGFISAIVSAVEISVFYVSTIFIADIVSDKYGCPDLPIMSDLNFGHTSPICILPYGAEAELNIDKLTFSILESAVKRCG